MVGPSRTRSPSAGKVTWRRYQPYPSCFGWPCACHPASLPGRPTSSSRLPGSETRSSRSQSRSSSRGSAQAGLSPGWKRHAPSNVTAGPIGSGRPPIAITATTTASTISASPQNQSLSRFDTPILPRRGQGAGIVATGFPYNRLDGYIARMAAASEMTGMMEQARVSAGIGGSLAKEFANTASWHRGADPVERLRDWRDVLRWATEQGLVAPDQADDLAEAPAAVAPVIALCVVFFRIAVAAARGETPEARDLHAVLAQPSAAQPAAIWSNGARAWRFQREQGVPQLLGIVARDAVALLTSERLTRLRLCAGSRCGWLFLDERRGKPRRWCSMSDCGNRSKAQRAYAQRKV